MLKMHLCIAPVFKTTYCTNKRFEHHHKSVSGRDKCKHIFRLQNACFLIDPLKHCFNDEEYNKM